MVFKVELEQEQDGRWIAEVVELPGAMRREFAAALPPQGQIGVTRGAPLLAVP